MITLYYEFQDKEYEIELASAAVTALREAKHAGEAERAFNQFAPYVSRAHRLAVWCAV